MQRRFSVNFALFSICIDALVVCLSLAAATYLRPDLAFLPFAAHYPEVIKTPWVIYPIFSVLWIIILLLFSVYDGRRNLRGVDEFISLTIGALLAGGAMAGMLYLTYREVSRLLFVVFILLAYLGMLAWRAAARLMLQSIQNKPGGKRRVLIVGAGAVGQELNHQILKNPQSGLQVVGFLDDNQHKNTMEPGILGPLEKAPQVIREKLVDDVVIALPQSAYQRTNTLVSELHQLPVKIWIIPDYFRLALHKAAIAEFAGIPMLDLRAPALNEYQRLVKRAFDLTAILIGLPVALPIIALVALVIKLERRGPAFLLQERVGENGRIFKMIKFRTMIPGAEQYQEMVTTQDELGNLVHKIANDPRVTPLGRLLRRSSLDELPQIFNVLRGEMSLVGPRPELPYLVEKYESWQRQRFAVPQGMTGWWQINGRSDKPMHLNTEDDLYYVQNYSLLLDIYILIKTIGVVLKGKGAF